LQFFSYFKIIFEAVAQIALIGLSGYIFAKKKAINEDGVRLISNGVVNFLLPCYIFVSLIRNFNFQIYSNWWLFPLISLFITALGFFVGLFFFWLGKGKKEYQNEFISLVAFQNSGYLPLMLVNLVFDNPIKENLTIIIFLFLLGFNFVFWSFVPYYLDKKRKIAVKHLFSPPVVAIILSLILIFFKFSHLIPKFFLEAASMLGNCVLPLAILVVGASLALISSHLSIQFAIVLRLLLVKLIILPLLCLIFIFFFKPSREITFLILLEASMPSATSLSVVTKKHNIDEDIISLGIFWTHIGSLITVPVWLIVAGFLKN